MTVRMVTIPTTMTMTIAVVTNAIKITRAMLRQ